MPSTTTCRKWERFTKHVVNDFAYHKTPQSSHVERTQRHIADMALVSCKLSARVGRQMARYGHTHCPRGWLSRPIQVHHRELLGLQRKSDTSRLTGVEHDLLETREGVLDARHRIRRSIQTQIELGHLGTSHSANVGHSHADVLLWRRDMRVVELRIAQPPAEAEHGVVCLAGQVSVQTYVWVW